MVDYTTPVINKYLDEHNSRFIGTILVLLAALPNLSVLRCTSTEVTVRSVKPEGTVIMLNYFGALQHMAAFHKVLSTIHELELVALNNGVSVPDPFIVVNAMVHYLRENGYDFSFADVDELNNQWLALALSDIIVADHEGDPANIKRVIERQLAAYRKRFQPELK